MKRFAIFIGELLHSEKSWPAVVLIVLLWLVLFVPFAGFPSLQLEEGTRALQARDIILHHDWLDPKVLNVFPYYNKPIMLPWLITVTAYALGGVNDFTARVPSLLATLAIALLVYWVVRAAATRRAAIVAGVAAMLTPSIMLVASVAETDVLSAMFAFSAFAVFLHGDRGARVTLLHWLACGFLMGCAALSKGPIPLIYPIGGIALFRLFYGDRRDWAWLALAVLIASAMLAVWVAPKLDPATRALWIAQMRLDQAVNPPSVAAWLMTMIRFVSSFFVANMPVDLLALLVVLPSFRRRLELPERLACALSCYVLFGTAILTFASAARPRYGLPAEPALAAAAGLALEPLWARMPRFNTIALAALAPLALFQVIRSDIVNPLRAGTVRLNEGVGEALDAEISRAPAPVILLGDPFDLDCLFYLRQETVDLIAEKWPQEGPVWVLFGDGGVKWPPGFEHEAAAQPTLDLRSLDDEPFRLYRLNPNAPSR